MRRYQARLASMRLFPVVVSLRGHVGTDTLTTQSLLDVVLREGFERTLEDLGLLSQVQLTAAQDLLAWLERSAPAAVRAEVEQFVLSKSSQSLASLRGAGEIETAGRLIADYCEAHAMRPEVAAGVKPRLAHIYRQITACGNPRFTGLLLVIDEFEGWSKHRTSPELASQDAEFLETVAYLLPKDLGLQVFTVVASQSAPPSKLMGGQEGDRFIHIPLLAERNAHDYDLIISHRVRALREDRFPEINDHHSYYASSFDFARTLSQDDFRDTFPFQPRCFEVVRHITARDLPTTRSGILVFHEVVSHPKLLARDTLVRVCDLLQSAHLASDCLVTGVYKGAYLAYQQAVETLPTLMLDGSDLQIARDVLATLFLWHLAYIERPRPLTLRELAEATLTVDDVLKAEDSVAYVLMQMRALPQIEFDDKVAAFVPKGGDGLSILSLFNSYRQRVSGDRYRLQRAWTESLFLPPQETRGQPALFSEYSPDQMTAFRVVYRNLEYVGQVAVGLRWQSDWALPLPKEDVHFRIVILTPEVARSLKASHLQDPRIAVVYPGDLGEEATQAAIDWLAWRQMSDDFAGQTGQEAEEVREWLAGQRSVYLSALLQTHLNLYRSGTIITRDDLGISAREVFGLASNEQRLSALVDKLLTAAYSQMPVDGTRLRSTLNAAEAGKVFDGYFSRSPSSTQVQATRNYGVGLGLSHPDQPSRFGPQPDCKTLELMTQMLEERQGTELPAWKIYERLSGPPYGLPYVAIQLYLLAFVRRNNPRVELILKREHRLKTREDRPLQRNSLRAATIAEIAWKPGLERAFDALLPEAGPSWNDTIPYAIEVVPDLRTTSDEAEIEHQSDRLRSSLALLASEAKASQETLGTLERALGEAVPPQDRQALAQVQLLATGDDYMGFYEQCESLFGSPDVLRDTLRAHNRMKELAGLAARINEVKRYLDAVRLRPEHRELQLDHAAIEGQLSLATLAAQPSRWGSIEASFQQFKARYRNEYQRYHRDTNTTMASLAQALEEAPRKLQALALLNSISELGPPVGTGLQMEHDRLGPLVAPCAISDYRNVDIEAAPVCPQCRRTLVDEAPVGEVQGLLQGLEAALTEQGRRLASEAIRRVLGRSGDGAMDRFLKVAQAADVSALVDALDDSIVALVRELLAQPDVVTDETDVLRRFAERYPTLEEEDVPAALQHLEWLLRDAFEKAKIQNPDKATVRLTIRW
ncbi:MAG: hypothetical protein ACUVX9_09380 [Anaerolineae bacterium]